MATTQIFQYYLVQIHTSNHLKKEMARSKKKPSTPNLPKDSTPVVYSLKKQLGQQQHLHSTSIFKKSPVYDLLHYFEKAPD